MCNLCVLAERIVRDAVDAVILNDDAAYDRIGATHPYDVAIALEAIVNNFDRMIAAANVAVTIMGTDESVFANTNADPHAAPPQNEDTLADIRARIDILSALDKGAPDDLSDLL